MEIDFETVFSSEIYADLTPGGSFATFRPCSKQLCQDEPTHKIATSKLNEGWILAGSPSRCLPLIFLSRLSCLAFLHLTGKQALKTVRFPTFVFVLLPFVPLTVPFQTILSSNDNI